MGSAGEGTNQGLRRGEVGRDQVYSSVEVIVVAAVVE